MVSLSIAELLATKLFHNSTVPATSPPSKASTTLYHNYSVTKKRKKAYGIKWQKKQ